MPRTANERAYTIGERCQKCGDKRKHRNGACVTCTQRINAAKYLQRQQRGIMLEHRGHKRLSNEQITKLLANDAHSVSASARSRYLDSLTRKHFGLTGEDQQPVTCFGDTYRAQKHVGDPYTHGSRDERPDPVIEELRNAVKAIFKRLPDLVTIANVIDQLPPDMVVKLGNRERLQLRTANMLRELNGVGREIGQSNKGTACRVVILRDHARYNAMPRAEITAAYFGGKTQGRRMPAARASHGRRKALSRQRNRRVATTANPPLCARKLLINNDLTI